MTLKLLSWSWITLAFFAPELIASTVVDYLGGIARVHETTIITHFSEMKFKILQNLNDDAFFICKRMTGDRIREQWWYRYLVGIGGAINITGLMVANLVGFGTGLPGFHRLIWRVIRALAVHFFSSRINTSLI
jgi:hypothetical protein